LKAEASGYPEDEDKYAQYFRESKGIELDKLAIQKNGAKRGLDKLCLSSFWDKLTESNSRQKSEMIADPLEIFRFSPRPVLK